MGDNDVWRREGGGDGVILTYSDMNKEEEERRQRNYEKVKKLKTRRQLTGRHLK